MREDFTAQMEREGLFTIYQYNPIRRSHSLHPTIYLTPLKTKHSFLSKIRVKPLSMMHPIDIKL